MGEERGNKTIAVFGEKRYKERLKQARVWRSTHKAEVKKNNDKYHHKGGSFYDTKLIYDRTGLRKQRNVIRACDRKRYRKYKRFFAPDSQLHHEWQHGTAEYNGIALVETDQHMHGIIDVIHILEGEITLLTE